MATSSKKTDFLKQQDGFFRLRKSRAIRVKQKKRTHIVSSFFLEVRGVEPLSKITSMYVPTSVPFVFKISSYPRPRRSARSSTSLVNLGRCPQAWHFPIPYCVRTYTPMGAEWGPALPLIRQRVRSFRQHLFFFRLFNELPSSETSTCN